MCVFLLVGCDPVGQTCVLIASLEVSDTAARNRTTDESGPRLRATLERHARFSVQHTAIVPDDLELIRSQVNQWSECGQARLILTTGGTGFAPSDVTPEVRPFATRRTVC